MMCALEPDFVTGTVQSHASCIVQPGETYAQVIYYQQGFTYDAVSNDFDYNVTLVTGVKQAEYFARYLDAVR